MKKTFSRILGQHKPPKTESSRGFTSRGAVPMNSYHSPPPPPPPPPPRPPSGGGGNNNNSGGGSGSGSGGGNRNNNNGGNNGSGGGRGPDFHCSRDELTERGFKEDVVNSVTQSGYLSAWATNTLNAAGRQEFGDKYIQEYRSDDHAFRGKSQPSADDHKILRFYSVQGKPGGQHHASLQEMQQRAELRFNAAAHDTASRKTAFTGAANNLNPAGVAVAVSVKKFLDLPGLPRYSSEARFTPTIVEVEISRTVSDKQQVKVKDFKKGLEYSNEKSIGDLFSWLKFKPGS